jgi:xylan 1,4-beta-xylosidase
VVDAALTLRYDAGKGWRTVGPVCDAAVLSDEHAEVFEDGPIRALGFTGVFLGLWAPALSGGRHPADFDDVSYARVSA